MSDPKKPPGATGKSERLEQLRAAALRESEDKFRVLAEKSLVGVYLIQDDLFRYVNPRFTEIYHYEASEMVDRLGPKQLVLPEDWPKVEANIVKRTSGEVASIHYEFTGITKEGEPINLEVYGSRTTYRGRPAVIGTLLDITERKQRELLLAQAEEKYRSIFENAVEGVFQITPKGQFIVVNPALERMLGFDSNGALVADSAYFRHHLYVNPERRPEFMRILEKDGVALGFECELRKKDKTRIWVSMNARAVRDESGKTLYYEGTSEDITEQKKAEAELLRLNEFNRAVIDNAPVAIFTLDKSGAFASVNPALAALSGLGSEAEKKLIGFNWTKNPYTIKCGLAAHIKKGLQGKAFQLWDFPFITYYGDRNLYMDFKGVPLRGKNRGITGLLCIIEETTDRVKTRARLMQEARMSAIGRLAAGIAHELNNPLATLVAHSELAGNCLRSLDKSRDKKARLQQLKNYLDIIESQVFRCKNVTSDILNLPWKEGLAIKEIDVNRVMERVLEFIDTGKTEKRIVKEFSALPPVRGDISALRQVFVNLINNAIDAVEERMDATICIRTRASDGHVEIEVEDNGVGIPHQIADKIFEPFFTTKEAKKGLGLGLSLCQEFLSHMGGTVRVNSKPGFGTTFLVTIPMEGAKEGGDGR